MTAATLDAFSNSYAGTERPYPYGGSGNVRSMRAGRHQGPRHDQSGRARPVPSPGRAAAPTAMAIMQKDLDVFADDIFLDAMRHAPVALYASAELEQPDAARQGCAAGHCHRPA